AAALASVYRRAGFVPPPAKSPVDLAPDEVLPRVGLRAAEDFAIVQARHADLMLEWIEAVRAAGKLAPPEALPALLDFGAYDRSTRDAVLAVVGQRGRWLARTRHEWRYAAAGESGGSDWEDGSHELRRAYLGELRARDPAEGRARLEEALPRERARERAELLARLEVGLSMDDEPLLERCLDDRAREVRAAAAELLSRLAGSRLCARMIERITIRIENEHLEVTLPRTLDEGMMRDGVVDAPRGRKGKRAVWFEQMMAAIPPKHFCERFAIEPQALLALALASEWAELFSNAWERAAFRHRDADFAEALLAARPEMLPAPALWTLFDRDRRERFLAAELKQKVSELGERLAVIAEIQIEPFGEEFSRSVARAMHRVMAEPISYGLERAISELARRMNAGIGPELAAIVERGLDEADLAREIAALLRFRHAMHAAIEESA
ncbi:MAG TPA: DUF5691 domain-containing protein, partial [Polyangiaceae bacterium]|nr:DUF5691 domain-containing protein [Polyangiaceae bacterium]